MTGIRPWTHLPVDPGLHTSFGGWPLKFQVTVLFYRSLLYKVVSQSFVICRLILNSKILSPHLMAGILSVSTWL